MSGTGGHHVARIDQTVTPENLHARAEAVAVPDFNYLEQTIEAIAEGLTHGRHPDTGSAEVAPGNRRRP